MSKHERLKILQGVLGRGYKSGDEYLFFCPKCEHHKKKLSVNIEKDKFKCWICDYKGVSARRLIKRHGSLGQIQDWDIISGTVDLSDFSSIMSEKLFGRKEPKDEQVVPLPVEFKTLTSNDLPMSSRPAMKFLRDRGLSKLDILKWKIGYCSSGEYSGRIVIPSFNLNGRVNYFVGRSYTGNWRKYLSPSVSRDIAFNELYIDWNQGLNIVEGVFDAVVAENAIPILGSSLSANSELFKKIVQNDAITYIALDADAERKAMVLIKQLLEFDVELYKVDIYPYSDVGEMSKKEFQKRKNSAVRMNNETHLSHKISSI